MDKKQIIDRKNRLLRLVEALLGVVFLGFVVFVAPLKDAGYFAIPIILVPVALIFDGLLRFFVLNKGIEIDSDNDMLIFPKNYRRKSIALSDITSVNATKTLHTGAQLNSNVYSYDLNLQGRFGQEVLVFASSKARDEVLSEIRKYIKKS